MKNKFLNISIGVTLMLFGAGFLLRSIPTATAAPAPEAIAEGETSKIGRYMFQVYIASDNRRYGVVMDTETGKSKAYYYLGMSNGFVDDGKAFPDNPLGQ